MEENKNGFSFGASDYRFYKDGKIKFSIPTNSCSLYTATRNNKNIAHVIKFKVLGLVYYAVFIIGDNNFYIRKSAICVKELCGATGAFLKEIK